MATHQKSHLNIRINNTLLSNLKNHCNTIDKSMSTWVREALIEKLHKEGNGTVELESAKSKMDLLQS